jgi:S-adenosylmethionine:tRNA ribosyltransferase-isomerase
LKLGDFDYELPPERIAQWPLENRDDSRMLVVHREAKSWEDRQFREFPDLLDGNELIVVNNARVLPSRVWGRRAGMHAQPVGLRNPARHEHLTSQVEVLLLRNYSDDEWDALVRPGRKLPVGEVITFNDDDLKAEVIGRENFGLRRLRFSCPGNPREVIERIGHIPLPPYIKRADSPMDRERYQTVFARQGTASAAPTAGLHFTSKILDRIRERGVEIAEITLEVGLGTFEPIRAERLEDHHIHSEAYEIPAGSAEAISRARSEGRPVLAVGTTVVRALEDAAEKFLAKQSSQPPNKSHGVLEPGRAEANIFLYPGKPIRVVDQLLTNFHLPRSSLLALVAAFSGRDPVLRAYRHAVESEYRFYSYGDCMWIR